jgi:uncharacterized protein with HEPN domain
LAPEDRVRIAHMIEAAEAACGFISGRTRDDLENSHMLAFAVVRAIEIVGEAASRVSPAVRRAAREIPWTGIISMRNRLIHGYSAIDCEIVWKTVTEELPELIGKLRTLVAAR